MSKPTGVRLAAALLLGSVVCGVDAQQSATITSGGPAPPDPPSPGLGVNFAPHANDDFYVVEQDVTLVKVAASGLLSNDGDANADALTATLSSHPRVGAVTLNADGSFSYTPSAGFVGADTFSYLVSDVAGDDAEADVYITVIAASGGDRAPVANDDLLTVLSVSNDSSVEFNVLGNDAGFAGEVLTVIDVDGSALTLGSVTVAPSGDLVYRPRSGSGGTDTLSYTVSDGAATATATVTIVVERLQGVLARVCDDLTCGLSPGLDPQRRCPADRPLAMNAVINGDDGSKTIKKYCASVYDCEQKWWRETSGRELCLNYSGETSIMLNFSCHFCCVSDDCNDALNPARETLYQGKSR